MREYGYSKTIWELCMDGWKNYISVRNNLFSMSGQGRE